MKRGLIFLSLLALALTAAPASAQDGGGRRQRVREHILKRFDKDHDGKLNRAERRAAREALKRHRQHRREQVLKRFDKDQDGRLSREERKAARDALREHRKDRERDQSRDQNRRPVRRRR